MGVREVIDEELLQELLAKASSLYNDGDYKGAVEAWSEILKADPANTKAREGIQVSNLLMGEWDGAAAPSEPVVVEPADGPEPAANALTPEEVEAKLGEGIARVKKLLAEGRVPEALEGARGLIPIDPDSEEVQKIIEEAQQASEAAPFVEEHLTLARELMAQGRLAEAAGQCDKVLAVDRANPQAAALQAQIAGADDSSPPDTGTAEPVAPTDAPLELEMERTRPGRWFVVSFRETHIDGRRPAVADHFDAEGFPFLALKRFPDVSHALDRVAIDRHDQVTDLDPS